MRDQENGFIFVLLSLILWFSVLSLTMLAHLLFNICLPFKFFLVGVHIYLFVLSNEHQVEGQKFSSACRSLQHLVGLLFGLCHNVYWANFFHSFWSAVKLCVPNQHWLKAFLIHFQACLTVLVVAYLLCRNAKECKAR